MNKILAEAANNARGLAIDAIHKCSSGHLGLPLGSAEIGAVLYGNSLSHDPSDPKWINRDRFILSAGHGSMFLYGWLHISGYDLSLEEVKISDNLEVKLQDTQNMQKLLESRPRPDPWPRHRKCGWLRCI